MSTASVVSAGIFRAYDIRGIVGDDLHAETAEQIGHAFGSVVRTNGGSRVLMGCDARPSSPQMSGAFEAGLHASGCDVVDGGVMPTPLMYFGLHHADVDGGVEITASHNPSEYNGFKLCLGTATLFGEAIQDLLRRIRERDVTHGHGGTEAIDLEQPYLKLVRDRARLDRPLRIVVDAGNGMAGDLAPKLYRSLGCEVTELYCEIDGRFPNHHPDPTVEENVAELRRLVRDGDYDLGLGFDGDADRLGVIDEAGEIVWGDRVTIILARDLLSRVPGATVIFDVKCSKLLGDDIATRGGHPIMWKTGHSLIKQKMREEGALLAGEMSGHLFFGERFFGHDDAIFAGARLLDILAAQPRPFSGLLSDLPPMYSTPEIRRSSSEENKFEICRRLRDEFAAEHEIMDIDGVRVELDDGWGLVRASNTGPIIVLRFEATSTERLAEIRELVELKLERIETALAGGGE